MIGCIGVGGVILVPSLTQLDGIDVHTAVASCMFSYIFAGLTGLLVYQKHNSIEWRDAIYFFTGAAPLSYLGAFALTKIGGSELQLVCYSLVLLSAVFSLIQTCRAKPRKSAEDPVSAADAAAALEVGRRLAKEHNVLRLIFLIL
jgi:uncharacterized membrane protein YfcA